MAELGRQGAAQIGWEQLTRDEDALFSVDAVYRSLDRRVAQEVATSLTIKAIYAYDDGALDTFRVAKKRGIKCIFEHPTIYWRMVRKIQREEAELHPEWAPTLRALGDSDEKLERKDQELALADLCGHAQQFRQKQCRPCSGADVPSICGALWRWSGWRPPGLGAEERQIACSFCRSVEPGKGTRLSIGGNRPSTAKHRVHLNWASSQPCRSGVLRSG